MTRSAFPASSPLDVSDLAACLLARAAPGTRVLAGIDGPGASGKSTLADLLAAAIPGAVIVRADDFYLPSAVRPPAHGAIGSAFDLPRLRDQVVRPAAAGLPVRYQRYDWPADRLDGWISPAPGAPLIVEGVYCTEARLRDYYPTRIFCRASHDVRLARGLQRDGREARSQWTDEWMPAEDRYLETQNPEARAHLVLDTTQAAGTQLRFSVVSSTLDVRPPQ